MMTSNPAVCRLSRRILFMENLRGDDIIVHYCLRIVYGAQWFSNTVLRESDLGAPWTRPK